MKQYLAKYWWVFLLRGIFGVIFGVLAFVMPGITLATLVIVWGAYAFAKPELNREIGAALDDLIASGHVRPVIGARFPLERGAEALELIEGRGATGKVVLDVRG